MQGWKKGFFSAEKSGSPPVFDRRGGKILFMDREPLAQVLVF